MTDCAVKKGLIIHPGAIGDCILTLPLAAFMKTAIGLNEVHLAASSDYTGFYPTRTAIDRIRPLESIPFHRFFVPADEFHAALDTPLIKAFEPYEYIVSFLGTDDSHFESNLLFAVHCSHSADVVMLKSEDSAGRMSRHYIDKVAAQTGIEIPTAPCLEDIWIRPTAEDMARGADMLDTLGVSADSSICILHPGSGGRHKCWHLDNFLAVAQSLQSKSIKPLFLLGPAEMERFSASQIEHIKAAAPTATELPLADIVRLLSCADAFVGNDSGITHIAGALGKLTIVLFGTTNPAYYAPLGPNTHILQAEQQLAAVSLDDQMRAAQIIFKYFGVSQ